MDEGSGTPPGGAQNGYEVPHQYPAPPSARRSRAWGPGSEQPPGEASPWSAQGPPVVAPDDPAAALWGPSAVPASEPDRWGPAPAGRPGTALLDRPTVARRPVVAPPLVAPAGSPDSAWDWHTSHRLRNALLIAAAILLVGSLIAAFVVLRNTDHHKAKTQGPTGQVPGVVVPPVIADGTTVPTPPSIPPVTVVPVVPATTAAPQPTVAPTTAPPTTKAPTPTTRVVVPPTTPITASPPASPPTPTTRPTTTTITQPSR